MKLKLLLVLLVTGAISAQTITQSTSLEIVPGTVACSQDQGATTTDNTFFRNFILSDFDIEDDFSVTEVSFGVENVTLTEDQDNYPLNVLIFASNSTSVFPVNYPADYDLLATVPVLLTEDDAEELISVDIPPGVVIPAGSDLIIGLSVEFLGQGNTLFIGSNGLGQTGPSYILAPGCNLNTPGTYASINFPNIHLVMSVTGTTNLSTTSFLATQISVYPNPTSDFVRVELPNPIENVLYEVRDINGKKLLTTTSSNVDVSQLPKGMYLLNVTKDNNVLSSSKIIKK